MMLVQNCKLQVSQPEHDFIEYSNIHTLHLRHVIFIFVSRSLRSGTMWIFRPPFPHRKGILLQVSPPSLRLPLFNLYQEFCGSDVGAWVAISLFLTSSADF